MKQKDNKCCKISITTKNSQGVCCNKDAGRVGDFMDDGDVCPGWTNKPEYYTDHTECIWNHHDENEPSYCPTTCSQYRDGWNDAMRYIFEAGIGYDPGGRKKRQGENE